MGCLYQLIILPFQILLFFGYISITIIKVIFEIIIEFYLYCIKCIPGLIIDISSLFTKNNNKSNYKQKNKKESQFDKESKLWGLTNEDKRIAKEERMSPSDYIEAEERDNDDLIDDD